MTSNLLQIFEHYILKQIYINHVVFDKIAIPLEFQIIFTH